MGSELDILGSAGLRFFGKMTTSICHEIKNVLAIINENAGLLKDLVLMADRGVPLDPERLKTLAGKIRKQVGRADGITENLNILAHSVDEFEKSVDLAEIIEFVVALSHRFASMQDVTLAPKHPGNSVKITTNPFFLENLVWLCLEFSMKRAGRGKTVSLTCEETQDGGRIRCTQPQGFAETPKESFPTEREKALLDALRAELATDVDSGEIVISLPGNIDH